MSWLSAVIYGVIQGIAEFLPISSSGHLALAQNFFGSESFDNYLAFNVLLHLGTLIAVCVVYYKDIWSLICGFFSLIKKVFTGKLKDGLEYGEKLFLMLCLATIPLVPAALLNDKVEAASGISWLIGIFLIINGSVLFISDKLNSGSFDLDRIPVIRALYIGLFQLIGVLPGISRSGSTITGGLFNKLDRKSAVKFSFLMSIPAILGACVLEIPGLFEEGISSNEAFPYILGMLAAIISGFFAIKLLQYIVKNKGFSIFSIYSIVVGCATVIYSLATGK